MSDSAVWSEEAERAALGALLLDGMRTWDYAANVLRLTPEAFYDRKHQTVAKAIWAMCADGRPVDVMTVRDRLKRKGCPDDGALALELDKYIEAIPTVSHAEYYLDIVRQRWILRGIQEVCRTLENEATMAERGEELLVSVPARFAGIIEEKAQRKTLRDILDCLKEKWRKAGAEHKGYTGLPTPWGTLNELTSGLQPGIYMLAARPSQGKTTVEDQLTEFLADQGIGVARATLDMTVERLVARMAARRSGVSLPKLNKGFAGESQLAKVDEAGKLIADYPMWLTDELHEINALCGWVRMLKVKHDIGLFTLDYIQQVEVRGREASYMNENQQLTVISRKFKRLALELKIPIVLLSQLNRGSDKDDRIPDMKDLRGSGSLEQDANVIILLYRDKEAADWDDRRPQWMDVCKNQDGPTGTIPFWFWASYFRFDEALVDGNGNWEWRHREPPELEWKGGGG